MQLAGNIVRQYARALEADNFAAKFPHVYLVIDEPLDAAPQEPTDVVGIDVADERPMAAQFDVIGLTKRRQDGHPMQLSVGRSSRCDVVLRHHSVSRAHAHFRIGGDQRLRLIDQASQNGTRIDGQVLIPERAAIVCVGDIVHFGAVRVVVMDGRSLFELASR